MKENQKKAFDFAADTTKQLIGISTGIVALMVTFLKDIIGSGSDSPKALLAWTWAIFILSILFGILTLMALTGNLQPMNKSEDPENAEEGQGNNEQQGEEINFDINNGSIRLFSLLQILTFLAAIILTAIFGYKSLNNADTVQNDNTTKYQIIRKSTFNDDTSKVYIDTLYLEK